LSAEQPVLPRSNGPGETNPGRPQKAAPHAALGPLREPETLTPLQPQTHVLAAAALKSAGLDRIILVPALMQRAAFRLHRAQQALRRARQAQGGAEVHQPLRVAL